MHRLERIAGVQAGGEGASKARQLFKFSTSQFYTRTRSTDLQRRSTKGLVAGVLAGGDGTARSGRSARSERSADTSPAPAPVGMKSSMPMIAM